MVRLMSHQSARRERQDDDTDADDGASSVTSWFPAGMALGVAGLATASAAITACVAISQSSDPPAVDDDSSRRFYLLALSGLFYAGIAELSAAVWVMAAEPRSRVAAGRRLVYAALVPLTAAAGLTVAALFW